ncbi:hypothetical protein [Stratiformator vulcanicus]|uniref:Uncharacterized protein n=1 Tax=Stratiformator vulcanicus TaxID=2527980 RepID=A0A517R4Y3_9PLAN|nr:hypothetical protein [Stratiformator vulcanicus]QDT38948.1 hypothetical protein Pan189_33480 [Stratiformator vulcanicus]
MTLAKWTLVAIATVCTGLGSQTVAFGQMEFSPHGFSGGYGDQLYPYDAPDPWMHGYIQEIPAYGGHRYFRPYNYKHLLAQSQTAAGFGMSPVMPYSQQFWHRYDQKVLPTYSQNQNDDGAEQGAPSPYDYATVAPAPSYSQSPAPTWPTMTADGFRSQMRQERSEAEQYQPMPAPNSAYGPIIVPASGQNSGFRR